MQAKKRKDRQDHDHEADEINDAIHIEISSRRRPVGRPQEERYSDTEVPRLSVGKIRTPRAKMAAASNASLLSAGEGAASF
jgi:hypothetical protein